MAIPSYNKYSNKKCDYDGYEFDSQAERKRYIELKALEKIGEITNLKLQVKFSYISDKTGKKLFTYIADFTYTDRNGKYHIEDVKGKRTKEFNLKKKLIEDELGYQIELIN